MFSLPMMVLCLWCFCFVVLAAVCILYSLYHSSSSFMLLLLACSESKVSVPFLLIFCSFFSHRHHTASLTSSTISLHATPPLLLLVTSTPRYSSACSSHLCFPFTPLFSSTSPSCTLPHATTLLHSPPLHHFTPRHFHSLLI